MPNELLAHAATGKTLYVLLLDAAGHAWNGSTFGAIDGDDWTDYAMAMAGAAGGIYLATMPSAPAGVYSYAVDQQAGASPAITDALRGTGSLAWDASAEIVPASAGSTSGTVARTYTLLSDVDSAPIPQARVEVWNSDDSLLITQAYTDNNGQVTFHLDPGTYNLRRTKAGWSFTNPDIETVEELAP